ncbi:MAG: hypothetical protein ACRDDY_14130 [Clostridium sp.]|uniref:hypothetical protein n=1 Tax=Clostridium sp. TaxID=1506 RepID=UPI003EE60B97
MKIAIRTFLNTVNVTDPAYAVVSGSKSSDGHQMFTLKVSFGYSPVMLHSSYDDLDVACQLFIKKITKIRTALQAALDAVHDVPTVGRVWLNGEGSVECTYTGNACWSIDSKTLMFSLTDCRRSARIQVDTDESDYKEQRIKIENLIKFLDTAIAYINNGR